MRTHLNVTRDLATDPWPVVEHFLRSPELWLPLPARAVAGDHHVVTVRLGPVLHAVRATVGDPWTLTDTISRRLAWVPCDTGGTPVHTSALPCFDGRIRIRHGDGVVTASLMGSYQPPGGPSVRRWTGPCCIAAATRPAAPPSRTSSSGCRPPSTRRPRDDQRGPAGAARHGGRHRPGSRS